jgi:hypothetical protein
MQPNQVYKFCNVAILLLKSVFFYGNRPTCDTRRLLRAILPEIPLKIYFIFLKKIIIIIIIKKQIKNNNNLGVAMDHLAIRPATPK